jgi:ABC-2 type transport system ATP-binding protein
VGYVSEDQYFYENMTAGWNLDFFGSFYPNRDRDLVLSLMKKFDIDPSKKVSELSKGMKVKLALALALAHRPELLILDEPTSGLDPVIRNELLELLLEVVQDENCSIFFSSHITSDIEKIADFVTFIEDGRIVISDEKDAILDKWRLFKVENSCSIAGLSERLTGVKKGEFGFSGITSEPESFTRELTSNYPDARYKVEKLSLDDLLVRIVREEEANEE